MKLLRLNIITSTVAVVAAALGVLGCSTTNEDVGTTSDELQCAGSCTSGDLNGDGLLTPITRARGLRSDWAPATEALPTHYYYGAVQRLRPDAHEAFVKMVKAAYDSQPRVDLYCSSGYRSFDTQCSLFASYASNEGCERANTYSAHAGHSEHQLGTVCDITLGGTGRSFLDAGDAGDVWLKAHAHEYGFANSYPHANASLNDGYIQEVWHYRFIGIAAAAALRAQGSVAVPVFIASLTDADRASLEAGNPATGGGGGGGGGACGDLTPGGRCSGTVLEWCKDGQPKSIDCATTTRGYTACGADPSGSGMNCVQPGGAAPPPPPPQSPCRGFDETGTCTGSVLEWCKDGAYARVDCTTKTDGRTSCGADPNPALGNNCIAP